MGHAKLALRERVLRSSVPDDPFMERELRGYFPRRLLDATGELYREHPLRREIAATIATNEVINDLGISWVWRCVAETGAEHADVVRAFYVARAVCHAKERWDVVEALFADPRIDTATQMELMQSVDWLVESLARWYLRERHLDDMTGLIERDEPAFVELAAGLRQLGSSEWRAERALRREALVARGVTAEVAEATAWHPELTYAPDVIAAVRNSGRTLWEAATAYFVLGERLHLDWLEQALTAVEPTSRWQRWAQASLDDDLRVLRREVTERVLLAAPGEPVEQAIEHFLSERADAVARLERLVDRPAQRGPGGSLAVDRRRAPGARGARVDAVRRARCLARARRHGSTGRSNFLRACSIRSFLSQRERSAGWVEITIVSAGNSMSASSIAISGMHVSDAALRVEGPPRAGSRACDRARCCADEMAPSWFQVSSKP